MTSHRECKASPVDEEENDAGGDEQQLDILNELSGDTLVALLQFMNGDAEEDELLVPEPARTTTMSTQNSAIVAETFRRLEEQTNKTTMAHEKRIDTETTLVELAYTLKSEAEAVLLADGIVMLESVLSKELCDECLVRINKELLVSDQGYDCNGFGKVHARDCRYDMYLENNGVFKDALTEMLCSGSAMEMLFDSLFSAEPAVFHEFSALISDPGSLRQPIHPDSKYTDEAVLYTCFIALQDIDESMGPTWFLPWTNTQDSHDQHTSGEANKYAYLSSCDYRKASLRKGDVAIMDSRTLHCGGANVSESSRRVLMYFTLRNPGHSDLEKDFPPNGSKWPGLYMQTCDF